MECTDVANFSPLTLAIELAARAHDGQKDMQGAPYIFHPLAVLAAAQAAHYDNHMLCAAVLHDVVEDCDELGFDDLAEDFDPDIVTMVKYLSRPDSSCIHPGCDATYDRDAHYGGSLSEVDHAWVEGGPEQPYQEFIANLCRHPRAARIKLLDIDHNLSRMEGVTDWAKRTRLTNKYALARATLIHALEPHGGRLL